MFFLDESGDCFFDESKGHLGNTSHPDKTEVLQAQQCSILKSLCEQSGKVITYESLFREAHEEYIADLGDKRTVAKDVQGKVYEIRKALNRIGIEDTSQLLITNRARRGYEIRLPENTQKNETRIIRGNDTSYATSFVQKADPVACYDKPKRSSTPKNPVVSYHTVGNCGYCFEFHLSRLNYKPSFASLALRFWDPLNLKDCLLFDNSAAFVFDVDNAQNALGSITVEFKYDSNHVTFKAETRELASGENRIRIPLAPMNYKPLSEISEICFVVHPETMNAIDGKVIIDNIAISLGMGGPTTF